MKNFIVLFIILSLGCDVYSQHAQYSKIIVQKQQPDAVSIFDIGTSCNAYGLSNGARTCLWADNASNTVVFFHRMKGDVVKGSRIAMDISKDGGATWMSNVLLYSPLGPPISGNSYAQAAGRYPQGVLYNPAGNTLGSNTYGHYFIPTLDGSNPGGSQSPWGGCAWGVRKADTLLPATQHNLSSADGYLRYIPNAFTITGSKTFVVEPALNGGLPQNYADTLIIGKGSWNNQTIDFDYNWEKLYVPTDWEVKDIKIAFSPDSLIGYISVLSHNTSKPLSDSCYFPILYKTTDGGVTWTGPMNINMYGPNGIQKIKDYLHDTVLISLYSTLPNRDSIHYGTSGNHALVVDLNGNPHIAVVVKPSSGSFTQYTPGTLALFGIYSEDGGISWDAWVIDSITNHQFLYGSGSEIVIEDNRVQAARTPDGSKLFFCWNDNYPNMFPMTFGAPNIFLRGLFAAYKCPTPVFNVTKFTLAYTQAHMSVMSPIVFSNASVNNIPFAYQKMNETNLTQEVEYKYIYNFKVQNTGWLDFCIGGLNEFSKSSIEVSQNHPNPCHATTAIDITLLVPTSVNVEICNLLGQRVLSLPEQVLSAGTNSINLNLGNLNAGAYYYSVYTDEDKITKLMLVQ